MNENWQQTALERILQEGVIEQRRRRRWGIFFKLVFILLIVAIGWAVFGGGGEQKAMRDKPHTALIDIAGPIMPDSDADADHIATSLTHAFEDKGTRGIILRINSPGGSPVQADYVYNEIRRQRAEHPNIKVYAVCADLCASAAYYIASAADEIYADPNSLVGSIGVIADGFGFVDTMKKLGVERRTYTAGDQKSFMDPFSPVKPDQVAEMRIMLDQLHQNFINAVKQGRGARLKTDPSLFSGRIWDGMQAKDLGLIDDFGSSGFVARTIIKSPKIVDYTLHRGYFERIAGRLGASAATQFDEDLGLKGGFSIR